MDAMCGYEASYPYNPTREKRISLPPLASTWLRLVGLHTFGAARLTQSMDELALCKGKGIGLIGCQWVLSVQA